MAHDIRSTKYDIDIWRGYDFCLPFALQQKEEVTVGQDLDNYYYVEYLPHNLAAPNNKVIGYAPIDPGMFPYVTLEIFSAVTRDAPLLKFDTRIEICGMPVDQGDGTFLRCGLHGGFSAVLTQYAAGRWDFYYTFHLSHNLTKDLDFAEAKYSITLTQDDHNGWIPEDELESIKALHGNILMIGE